MQQYYPEMGTSVPLQMGFDRYNSGRPGYNPTAPFGLTPNYTAPVPSPANQIMAVDIPPPSANVIGMGTQPQYLVTTQPTTQTAPVNQPEQEETPTTDCSYPGGLCANEMNQTLFNILTSKTIDIAYACDPWEFYPMSNPAESDLTWTWDQSFVYRDNEDSNWLNSSDFKLKYSRWGPRNGQNNSNNDKKPIRLLFLHDALDSRKSWWCCQKLLSPFFDTVSIDLVGSGDSIKPRGLSNAQSTSEIGDPFPWSFDLHARYLNDVAKIIWPKDNFYVVGLGWGAQIAANMAAMSENVAGIIMVNPPGFSKDSHPEYMYSDISSLANLVTDDDLSKSQVSYAGRIRDCLLASMNNPKDCTREGSSPVRLILNQYTSLDRQRVLIDQIQTAADLQYQEFPKTEENPNGLQVDAISAPCLIVSGLNDIVYPPEHRNFYSAVYYNSSVQTRSLRGCGHLMQIEDPKSLAEIILSFIREKEGFAGLKDAFIGFYGSSQGNERSIVSGLKSLYLL